TQGKWKDAGGEGRGGGIGVSLDRSTKSAQASNCLRVAGILPARSGQPNSATPCIISSTMARIAFHYHFHRFAGNLQSIV
ncbi:MAG TPA: hypothetical protein VHX65_04960, partial [Pirellulales bacterium]|nr:hypothetical protein [Pirellulales bacterium]